MKTSTVNNQKTGLIYTSLLISSTLIALFAVRNIKISPDSMLYSLMSQEILSGNGLKIPVIKLFDNYIPVNGKVPYPEEAPLLSIVFALLGGVSHDNFLPAQIINSISLIAISLFIFLIMNKLHNNMSISFITAILVSISFPILNVMNHIWTEPLFIAFSISTLYFMILSRQNAQSGFYKNIFTAGILATLAFLTRFSGLFLIPGFYWITLIMIKNKESVLKYSSSIFSSMLPLIAAGIIFIHNYTITSNIYGWEPPPFKRSFIDALTVTIQMIFQQFPLGRKFILLIVLFIFLFILLIILNIGNSRQEFRKYLNIGLDLAIILGISYIVLIALALSKSQPIFEVRFVFPLVPFLFVIFISCIVFFWKTIQSIGYRKLSLLGLVLSLVIVTSVNCYKTYLRHRRFLAHKEESHYSVLKTSTYKWTKEHYGKSTIITTNRAYPLSFFGGYTTVALPHKRFMPTTVVPENMEIILPERMSRFGSRVLVLFEKAEEKYDGRYITKLFYHRKNDKNFRLIREFEDGVIYELKNMG
jgi:hypothetical protein